MRHYVLTLLNHEYQNIEHLPAKYNVGGDKFVAWALIVFGIAFGLESIVVAIKSAVDGGLLETVAGSKHIVFGPMGVLFFAWGINQFLIKGKLVIDRFSVSCSYKNLLGRHEWSETLSNYRIRKKVGGERATMGASSLRYCIWLWHDRQSRRVKIYEASSNTEWEERAEFYSQLFRLQRTDHEKGK